ncbi:tetratricopeptide repeat protein [Lentzea alba]
MHREVGFRVGEGYALDTLGHVELHSGRPARAVERYRQALELRRELGDTYEIANTLFGLGRALAVLDEPGRAREVWEAMDEPQLTRG